MNKNLPNLGIAMAASRYETYVLKKNKLVEQLPQIIIEEGKSMKKVLQKLKHNHVKK